MAAVDVMTGPAESMRDSGAAGATEDAKPPSRPIRVAVVDDDPMIRSGLRLLLGGSPDIEVVAEAADGIEAQTVTDAHWPDVLLVDIRMPRCDGLEATRRLRARPKPPYVIVLTAFDVDNYVIEALRSGASGFLVKDTPPREILAAIRKAAAGEAILYPRQLRKVFDHIADPAAVTRRHEALSRMAQLTEREREVAIAVGWCATNAEIAKNLGVGIPTVKNHVTRAMAKLELTNRSQFVMVLHDAGLLDGTT